MKKLKLLSSLSALVLVLSLGACNNNSEDDVTSDDVDSSETTPTVEDVTLSFSFVDATGAASTIPEYATAYVIGSWDSWSEFIPLTEKDGAYSTKFNELEIGSFTYKVVEWYTGESVSWSDCVEITTTDQTLTISEEDANSTISVTHTLSAVLDKLGVLEGEEAEEIIVDLLCAVNPAENGWIEDIWEGGHFEEEWLGDTDIIYMTLNDYGYEEGTWETIEEDGDTSVKYIVGGAVYNVVDGEFEFSSIYNDSYESLCDTYSYIVLGVYEELITSSVEYDNDGEEVSSTVELDKESIEEEGLVVTIERTVTGYILNVASATEAESEESDVITLTTDRAFNLLSVEEVEIESDGDITSNFGEKITQAEVEARLADFTSSVESIVKDATENCNYLMQVIYTDYESKTYTEDDLYDEEGNRINPSDLNTMTYGVEYMSQYYFTEDSLVIYYYYYYFNNFWDYGWALMDAELYVNNYEYGITDVYYLDDDASYATDMHWAGYYSDLYQNIFYTVLDLEPYAGDALLAASGTYGYYGPYEEYAVTYNIAYVLWKMATCNNWIAEGLYFDTFMDAYDFSYLKCWPEDDEIDFGFDTGAFWVSGHMYATDDDGNYILDEDGNRTVDPTTYYWTEWLQLDAAIAYVGAMDNSEFIAAVNEHINPTEEEEP